MTARPGGLKSGAPLSAMKTAAIATHVALVLLVRGPELDALRELRKFRTQHFARLGEDDTSPFPARHPSEDEQRPDVVEFRIMRDGVAKADADRLVDAACAVVARGHEL